MKRALQFTKETTFIFILSILISACNSTKKVQKNISTGNYDKAIAISVKKLRKSTKSKKKQKHILLLEDAFKKATDADLRNLDRLKLDRNPAVIEKIFETYNALDKRQELIIPLLPLFHTESNRNASFLFTDYTTEINTAKATLSDYLYANARKLLRNNNKKNARKAYTDLEYLNKISPNFKDVTQLLDEAHFKGTNFIIVQLKNQTNQVIPKRLEDDLLDFDTYGLNKFWTVFHSNKDTKLAYDYQLQLIFNRIDVSPERIQEKHSILEKEVKDGFEYQSDGNGNVLRDSLGNAIKIDKFKIVKSNFYEIHQEKASHIAAEVILESLGNSTQKLESFPLDSEFIFIHDFGEMSGDKRALDTHHLDLLRRKEVPFPTNEQMIFDTGEDLKEKLKSIIDDFNL